MYDSIIDSDPLLYTYNIFQVINKAIPIFEKAYPGHIGVFAFDNSSGHACKADDALVASWMNLLSGGKQPWMRNTVFPTNPTIVQHMVFQPNDTEIGCHRRIPDYLIGLPKGMKRILQERVLWVDGLHTRCPGLKRKSKGETEEHYTGRILAHKVCEKGGKCCAFRIMEDEEDLLMRGRCLRLRSLHVVMSASSTRSFTAS